MSSIFQVSGPKDFALTVFYCNLFALSKIVICNLDRKSLIFTDLFHTRVQPSKMFDVLKEDFEHWLIASVVLSMLLASFITQKLASRKALNRQWKWDILKDFCDLIIFTGNKFQPGRFADHEIRFFLYCIQWLLML